MESKLYVLSIVSIIGIFLTALFSSIGYFYKVRSEKKKSIRKTLYLLLEIRYSLSLELISASKVKSNHMSSLNEVLLKRGIKLSDHEIDQSNVFTPIIDSQLDNIKESKFSDIDDDFITAFEESLSQLSESFPVLAYKLKGKDKLKNLSKLKNTSIMKLKHLLPEENLKGVEDDFWPFLEGFLKERLKHHLLDSFNKPILMLAEELGKKTYAACQDIINIDFEENTELSINEVEILLDAFIQYGMKKSLKS